MTHVFVDPDSVNWSGFLNTSDQTGGGSGGPAYFAGTKYMRGFGVFHNIARFLTPIAKNLAYAAGSEGVQAGQRLLKDVTEGKNFSESMKEHAAKGISNLGEKLRQCGKGNGRKSKKKKNIKLVRKIVSFPQTSSNTDPYIQPTKKQRNRKPDQLDYF
jgi:histone H3/H4